jgi:hypothetical protein
MSAPAWAVALVEAVCADAGVAPPRLSWRGRRGEHSTGVARRHDGMIAVRAGADVLDQRLTLLHELAHWLAPAPARRDGRRRRRTPHHDVTFYRIAFDLYRRHGLADADALRLESAHYPSSLRHAVALGIEGAGQALMDRRAALRARPARRWRVLVPEHPVRLARDGRWHVCSTCGQRIVGSNLSRMRRARRPLRHVLMGAEAVAS